MVWFCSTLQRESDWGLHRADEPSANDCMTCTYMCCRPKHYYPGRISATQIRSLFSCIRMPWYWAFSPHDLDFLTSTTLRSQTRPDDPTLLVASGNIFSWTPLLSDFRSNSVTCDCCISLLGVARSTEKEANGFSCQELLGRDRLNPPGAPCSQIWGCPSAL